MDSKLHRQQQVDTLGYGTITGLDGDMLRKENAKNICFADEQGGSAASTVSHDSGPAECDADHQSMSMNEETR